MIAQPFEGTRGIVLRAEHIHGPEAGLFLCLRAANAQEFQERPIYVSQAPVALLERDTGPRYNPDPVEHIMRRLASAAQGAPDQHKGDKAQCSDGRVDRYPGLSRESTRLLEIIEHAHRHADEKHKQE